MFHDIHSVHIIIIVYHILSNCSRMFTCLLWFSSISPCKQPWIFPHHLPLCRSPDYCGSGRRYWSWATKLLRYLNAASPKVFTLFCPCSKLFLHTSHKSYSQPFSSPSWCAESHSYALQEYYLSMVERSTYPLEICHIAIESGHLMPFIVGFTNFTLGNGDFQ